MVFVAKNFPAAPSQSQHDLRSVGRWRRWGEPQRAVHSFPRCPIVGPRRTEAGSWVPRRHPGHRRPHNFGMFVRRQRCFPLLLHAPVRTTIVPKKLDHFDLGLGLLRTGGRNADDIAPDGILQRWGSDKYDLARSGRKEIDRPHSTIETRAHCRMRTEQQENGGKGETDGHDRSRYPLWRRGEGASNPAAFSRASVLASKRSPPCSILWAISLPSSTPN